MRIALLCVAGCGSAVVEPVQLVARDVDPLRFETMPGPFSSLDAYCEAHQREAEAAGDEHYTVGACPHMVVQLAPPFRAAAVVSFDETSHFPLELWQLAIQTPRGWFVADAPMCAGRGCENEPQAITLVPVEGGGPLIRFAFAHSEGGRTGSFEGQATGHAIVLCTLGSFDRPACTATDIPMDVEATGTDSDGGDLTVALRLELDRAWRDGGTVSFAVAARRREVEGTILEADAWRERLAGLVGSHVLRVP